MVVAQVAQGQPLVLALLATAVRLLLTHTQVLLSRSLAAVVAVVIQEHKERVELTLAQEHQRQGEMLPLIVAAAVVVVAAATAATAVAATASFGFSPHL